MDTIGLSNTIFQNIISPGLQRSLFPIRLILILISFIVIILLIWLFKKSSYKNFLYLDWLNDYKLLKSIRMDMLDQEEVVVVQKEETKEEVKEETKEEVKVVFSKQPQPEKKIEKIEISDWQRIIDKLETKDELKCKLALLDADRLLDKSLTEKEKDLKSLSNFQKIEKIKEYLERLLDNPRKGITFRNATNIIREYKIALKEIGAI